MKQINGPIHINEHTFTFRGYHTAVFISARLSSPSVDNCPRHSQRQFSTGGLGGAIMKKAVQPFYHMIELG